MNLVNEILIIQIQCKFPQPCLARPNDKLQTCSNNAPSIQIMPTRIGIHQPELPIQPEHKNAACKFSGQTQISGRAKHPPKQTLSLE